LSSQVASASPQAFFRPGKPPGLIRLKHWGRT